MAEIINLRRARKAKARVVGAQAAAEARVFYGRTKAERAKAAADADAIARTLDGARREDSAD